LSAKTGARKKRFGRDPGKARPLAQLRTFPMVPNIKKREGQRKLRPQTDEAFLEGGLKGPLHASSIAELGRPGGMNDVENLQDKNIKTPYPRRGLLVCSEKDYQGRKDQKMVDRGKLGQEEPTHSRKEKGKNCACVTPIQGRVKM